MATRLLKHYRVGLAAGALLLATAGAASRGDQGRQALIPQESTLYLVYSSAAPGKEREYDAWYEKHIGDIRKLSGVLRAQRFLARDVARTSPKYRYLVLYEVRGEPTALLAQLRKAVAEGRLEAPPEDIVPRLESAFYEPLRSRASQPKRNR